MPDTKIYRTQDAPLEPIAGKTIAILGYGIQGSAQAANFREGNFNVIVGGRPGPSLERAKSDGFQTHSYHEATEKADIVCLLIPDAVHREVFGQIQPVLKGKTLVVAGGLSLFSKIIQPADGFDVIMVAPSGSGSMVRSSFLSKQGMVASFAVHQDASGHAKQTALALCRALGFTQMGVLECRVKDEAACDAFGEQAILCGGVAELLRQAYQTLVERGYSKEMAYLGTLYELRGIMDLYQHFGIDGMYEHVSEAARFGGLKSGSAIIDSHVRQNLEKILDEIESGAFMTQFETESQNGFAWTKAAIAAEKKKDINQTGAALRRTFGIAP